MRFNGFMMILFGTLVLCASPSLAFDLNEGDLKAKTPVDDSKNKKLDSEVNDASLGAEIDADQIDADRVAAEQAKADEHRLQDELAQIKQKKKDLEGEKEKVKSDTQSAFKSLNEQQIKNKQAHKELDALQKEKAAEDIKLNAAKNELQTVENEGKALAEEQRKIQMHIQMAKEEREAAVKRMTELRAQATMSRQRQAQQLKNIDVYRKKTKEFVERETAKTQAIAQARSR